MKEYIKDDGKVRYCDSNMAKMNVFEFAYYYIFHWGYFQEILGMIGTCICKVCEYGWALIWNLFWLTLTPVTIIVRAFIMIKNAKESCTRNSKINSK